MKILSYLFLTPFLLLTTQCTVSNDTNQNCHDVNVFIGTDYHGHTYPGAVVPEGLVQLSPDTRTTGWDACSGYHYSDSVILGFSHTHLSGTGIGDMGDVLLMPFTEQYALVSGEGEAPGIGYKSAFKKENENASVAYYSVFLDDCKVLAELTATPRVGLHRYTFPTADTAGFILDFSHILHHHEVVSAHIEVISNTEIIGTRKIRGWAKDRSISFSAQFSKPFDVKLFENDQLVKNKLSLSGTQLKAVLSFPTEDNEQVLVKVGISGVDEAGATLNRKTETPDFEFDNYVSAAKEMWDDKLNAIQVKGGSQAEQETFYTALYHANLFPMVYSDVDGRYLGQDLNIHQSKEKDYTIFSLWDTYRAQHPLFTIIKPAYNQALVRSLLRKHKEGGILPMWDLASIYTGTMIGSHAVSVIADAYMKGYRDYDVNLALEAMIQAVEYDSVRYINYPNEDFIPWIMPKGKLYYKQYGYIPCDLEHSSTSRGLEYAFNYWCIARVAEDMGKEELAKHYYERASHYKNYFDKTSGFMRGKRLDGSWDTPFNPRHSAHWKTPYVEGNAWQWTWYVPQDVEGLIQLYGGKAKFTTKLDSLFSITSEIVGEEKSADISGLIGQYAHGNEPSHHISYLYNYADQPWKTQELVTRIMKELYSNQPDGICGNEDCGQMSAWYILNALGFYPVCPGSNNYSIGVPLFEEARIQVGDGKTFTVKKKNIAPTHLYVQKVMLNGKPLTSHLISHKDIVTGGELVFEMGEEKAIFWE